MIKKILLANISDNCDVIIITPILSAFKKLIDKLGCTEINESCFFHNSTFTTKNGTHGMIISIPQGIGAQDVMYALSNKDIFFYGYAGSLTEEIPIGTIVEASSAIIVNENRDEKFRINTTGEYRSVISGYSPCLLGDLATKYCDESRKYCCQVVDMETAFCARAALKNNNYFYSKLVISDIPGSINFWEVDDNTKLYFKSECNEALDSIVLYIDSNTRAV